MAGGNVISVMQMWLAGLLALGGVYLVGTHGAGLTQALGGAEKFVSGTEGTVLQGGK